MKEGFKTGDGKVGRGRTRASPPRSIKFKTKACLM